MVQVHSLSQTIRGRERDFILNEEQKKILEELNYDPSEL
jgi:hypothetical protein